MTMVRLLLQLVSPAESSGRLSILIFHRVTREPDSFFPDEMHAPRFRAVCTWLRDWFNVLPLDEACARLRDGALPARAAAITFDDGYADNHDVALPILRERGLHATFFVATGFLDGGCMWNDVLIEAVRNTACERLELEAAQLTGITALPVTTVEQRRAAIDRLIRACRYLPTTDRDRATAAVAVAARVVPPTSLMMTSSQVRALHTAGMSLGGHTVSHPILTRLSATESHREIKAGKETLERLIQAPVRLFAYPNGRPGEDYLPIHAAQVAELGFEAAVTTAWGTADKHADRFQLPRFTPWDRRKWAFGLRLASNLLVRPVGATQ